MRHRIGLAKQRGVAVITALLLTTLAVTIVASLFWQQQVQVRSMENQRLHLQTKWILRGALELSSLILKSRTGQAVAVTTLDQVWTTPLAETRLDQYIERERVENEVFDATLSGNLSDATARYNMNLLVVQGTNAVDPDQLAIFKRLLGNLQLDPGLAVKVAQLVAAASPVIQQPAPGAVIRTPTNVPMGLVTVDDLLAVPGVTRETVDRLRPFVSVLPADRAPATNVNTAPAEVISALVENCSMSQANAIVENRKRVTYIDPQNLLSYNNGAKYMHGAKTDVKSSFFLAHSRIRLDRAALDAESLIESIPGGQTTVLWTRQN